MMNVVGKAIDTLAGMAEENNRVEPVTRFCPDCGRVGSVGDEFKDCCPDGIHARMIPESMAKRCHDLFQIVVQGLKESASVPPGWKLVPVEPTLSMLIAWERAEQSSDRDVYRAILEAAPVPEGGA